MRDYKKIKAYILADNFVICVYKITKGFPKDELYGITSQIRRAALSIPANIAEGASRKHKREYLHFLYISRGSLSEIEYLLHVAQEIGYLEEQDCKNLYALKEETAKTLYGLISSVENEI